MSYKFELTCLSWECEGQTIREYGGLKQAYEDLGNIDECPECGEIFKITENHISIRWVETQTQRQLQEPLIIPVSLLATFSDKDLDQIVRALEFSALKLGDHRRNGNEKIPFVNHPIEVFGILWRIGNVRYIPTLVAAILHGIIKDTETDPEEISSLFGQEVLNIVLEVTDDRSCPNMSNGAKLIKIADKISNVSSRQNWTKERFIEYLDCTERKI
jgi:hypothetical protein